MATRIRSSPLRILVADDDPTTADLLQRLFEGWGHRVWAVHDGWSVLELAPRVRPDVFVLDINMPDMDGWQVTRWLREEGGFERSLVVALTGHGAPEDRQRSSEAGFDDHLTKPLDPAALRELVEHTVLAREPGEQFH
jgi:CheY-like chemotaxis protein